MSKLIVVRHAQASFFSDDYDKLSPLGERQSRELAKYWLARGLQFDHAYSGTLERQIRTAEVVGEAYAEAGRGWPQLQTLEALNEYPADEIMEHLLPELCDRDELFEGLKREFEAAEEPRERYRTFHRLLEAVMAEWIDDGYAAEGLQRWHEFRDGVRDAFRRIMSAKGRGLNVAVFTSGGPVGVSVQTVLGAPDIKAAELNWRVYNCSFTEFTFSGDRVSLDTFNAIPHLTDPELHTYR